MEKYVSPVSRHAILLLLVTLVACKASNPAAIVIPCDPMDPSSCPEQDGFASFCSLADGNVCVNVCQGADALVGGCETDDDCPEPTTCENDSPGASCECAMACPEIVVPAGSVSESGMCDSDDDCGSGLMCDNEDSLQASCTCVSDCVPALTVGGTPGNPVVWEEKFTCVDGSGACFSGGESDNNEAITFELVQDGRIVTGTVTFGQGEQDIFEGELCGNEFRWIDVTPNVVNPEQGCWTFTENRFTKRSFATGDFDCVGIGIRGSGSIPPDVISCEDLDPTSFDVSACPPVPPAAPESPP
ncbi:MAG: hypothetical protein AAF500_19390 [Myxococcota bacterium]